MPSLDKAFLADSPLPDPREIGGPNAADLLGLDMEVQRKSFVLLL